MQMQKKNQHFIMEMKDLCALFTTDVISTIAFGLHANSFKNTQGEFYNSGRAVFDFSAKRAIGFILVFFMPQLVPLYNFKIVPPKTTKFLRYAFNQAIDAREKSGIPRGDLIDILIDFKKQTQSQTPNHCGSFVFEGDLLLAQAAIFFTAGFESSSSTMAFALYELAKHTDLQQRLRDEIQRVLQQSRGKVTQNAIDTLDYMQMVLYEVLRLYPPLPFLDRECTASKPGQRYSLKPYHDFELPHGMPVYIPVYGLQTDPKYYPDPMNFDPERFSTENRKFLTAYTYMPFGAGPHGCVGERLAMLQTKIGLLHILRAYRVTTCAKTEANMEFNPKAVILQAKNGIYLNFVHDPLNINTPT